MPDGKSASLKIASGHRWNMSASDEAYSYQKWYQNLWLSPHDTVINMFLISVLILPFWEWSASLKKEITVSLKICWASKMKFNWFTPKISVIFVELSCTRCERIQRNLLIFCFRYGIIYSRLEKNTADFRKLLFVISNNFDLL